METLLKYLLVCTHNCKGNLQSTTWITDFSEKKKKVLDIYYIQNY